ncbi:MAG: hypothetical protein SGCHY_000643 [Lobulomycetales sp.]
MSWFILIPNIFGILTSLAQLSLLVLYRSPSHQLPRSSNWISMYFTENRKRKDSSIPLEHHVQKSSALFDAAASDATDGSGGAVHRRGENGFLATLKSFKVTGTGYRVGSELDELASSKAERKAMTQYQLDSQTIPTPDAPFDLGGPRFHSLRENDASGDSSDLGLVGRQRRASSSLSMEIFSKNAKHNKGAAGSMQWTANPLLQSHSSGLMGSESVGTLGGGAALALPHRESDAQTLIGSDGRGRKGSFLPDGRPQQASSSEVGSSGSNMTGETWQSGSVFFSGIWDHGIRESDEDVSS